MENREAIEKQIKKCDDKIEITMERMAQILTELQKKSAFPWEMAGSGAPLQLENLRIELTAYLTEKHTLERVLYGF